MASLGPDQVPLGLELQLPNALARQAERTAELSEGMASYPTCEDCGRTFR
jgi:hypothetical protein